jgi:hypothetical protein
MPTFDFGALTCWYERLFNRTYLEEPTAEKLDKNVYLSLRHVSLKMKFLYQNLHIYIKIYIKISKNLHKKSTLDNRSC